MRQETPLEALRRVTAENVEKGGAVYEETFKYVTVYRVTRHYGGPEEGGWWYNWYEPVHTEDFRNMEQRDALQKEWRDRDHGDIYSVLGGEEYRVYAEALKHESATTERPHYE